MKKKKERCLGVQVKNHTDQIFWSDPFRYQRSPGFVMLEQGSQGPQADLTFHVFFSSSI